MRIRRTERSESIIRDIRIIRGTRTIRVFLFLKMIRAIGDRLQDVGNGQ